MLKLIYTEMGVYMEQVPLTLDAIVSQRVLLSMQSGTTLHVEPSQAAFLLYTDTAGLDCLGRILHRRQPQMLAIAPVDTDCVEVTLEGTWLAAHAEAEDGVFLAAYDDETEELIYGLWHASEQPTASRS